MPAASNADLGFEAGYPEEERETKTAASRKVPVRLNRLMF
jgi:hypothetical protein